MIFSIAIVEFALTTVRCLYTKTQVPRQTTKPDCDKLVDLKKIYIHIPRNIDFVVTVNRQFQIHENFVRENLFRSEKPVLISHKFTFSSESHWGERASAQKKNYSTYIKGRLLHVQFQRCCIASVQNRLLRPR